MLGAKSFARRAEGRCRCCVCLRKYKYTQSISILYLIIMCGARARVLSFATSSSSSSPCFQPNNHHKVIALALTRTAHHHTQLGTPFHIKIIHFHLKCPIEIYSKIHCRYAHGTLFAFKCVYVCVFENSPLYDADKNPLQLPRFAGSK